MLLSKVRSFRVNHFTKSFYHYIIEFPWNELGDGASVCDVGSGVGTVSLQLAKTYPTLQLKLQDLPHVMLHAKNEVWPKEFPEAIKEGRIQFQPIDFLKESPIPGCNVYYVCANSTFDF